MMRYVSVEGGKFSFNFDQREEYPDVPPIVVQAMLVAPERKRRVKIPAGTPEKPQLTQARQSRITVALDGTDPRFSYRPAKSDHPDVGVRFDRKNAAASLAGRGLDSRPSLKTAKRRKTTTPLSGRPGLEPTHRLVDLNVPFGTAAVALAAGPSAFKLATLTNGDGGLGFGALQSYYRDLAAGRRQTEAESTTLADLNPEIPWIK